ncbi:hypothetical protein WMF18_18880 [Sorangium sp. So ce315]|uniref:hypothetical protein n=1 Tax=Sorangium sp. So ce315 TaxID=3133299 RepID=UPI003F6357DF
MFVRSLRSRSFAVAVLAVPLLASSTSGSALPRPVRGEPEAPSWLSAAIEGQSICVGSTVASAGELGDVLYYRSATGERGEVSVGYYAFFSEERPWGNNWLTWTVLPALAVDLVYTHGLLVGPGIQRFAYGKGDVEGFRIVYGVGDDGRLAVEHGVADRGDHSEVRLDRADLLSIDPERPTVYSRWWSHQLGGQGAGPGDLVSRRCYGPGEILPLPADVALDFRLDRRAGPARVVPAELLGQPASPRQGDQDLALRPSVAL